MIQIPHSPTTEQGILGALLLDPERIGSVNIEPEDFYIHRNRMVYQAMQQLRRDKSEVDYVSLCTQLDKAGQLGEIGGPAYITGLIASDVSMYNIETYAKILREKARRRRAIDIAQKLATAMHDEETQLDAGVADAMTGLTNIATSSNAAEHLGKYLGELYDEVEERYKDPKEFPGIVTGLLGYDKITGGLMGGELTVLSGDPGIGKSLLAFQLSCGMAKTAPGAVYQLEMSGKAVIRRQVSAVGKVETRKLRTGRMDEDDWTNFASAIQDMERLPIYMSDSTDWTTTAMRADLSRLRQYFGIKWFLVDYLNLLKDQYGKDETERTSVLSSRLHDMCKDLDLAGLVISGMNKTGMDTQTPSKAHLSGAARLVFDADQIIFLNQDPAADAIVKATWVKLREGDGTDRQMRLRRVPGFPAFAEVAN